MKKQTLTKTDDLDIKYEELMELIYLKLPVLLNEIAYKAFARVETIPYTTIDPTDMRFITPFLREAQKICNQVIGSKIEEMQKLTSGTKGKDEEG